MRRVVACLAVAGLSVSVLYAAHSSHLVPAPTPRTVYVNVFDNKGVPLTDLTAVDFSLKEGGKEYEVTKAEAATAPMQIAIVVDDNSLGAFRPAVGAFIQALTGKAEFEILTVVDRVQRVAEFGASADALNAGVATLVQRGAARDGAVLLEGVSEAAKDLGKRKAERPVIVAMTIASTDRSQARAAQVLGELKSSRATLHVISLGNALVQSNATGQTSDDTVNLNDGLDNGTKQSGGRRQAINAMADIQAALQKVLIQLKTQYLLSYTLPDGVKLNERLAVTVKRPGAVVLAPSRIPDK